MIKKALLPFFLLPTLRKQVNTTNKRLAIKMKNENKNQKHNSTKVELGLFFNNIFYFKHNKNYKIKI